MDSCFSGVQSPKSNVQSKIAGPAKAGLFFLKRQGLNLTGMKGMKGMMETPESSFVIPGNDPESSICILYKSDNAYLSRRRGDAETQGKPFES